MERFNLQARHVELLDDDTDKGAACGGGRDKHWEVYCRKILHPMTFYSFAAVNPRLHFFVVNPRAFAGRDAPAEDEATGRTVAGTLLP